MRLFDLLMFPVDANASPAKSEHRSPALVKLNYTLLPGILRVSQVITRTKLRIPGPRQKNGRQQEEAEN